MKSQAFKFLIFTVTSILIFTINGCRNGNSDLTFLNDMDMSAVWTDHPSSNLIVSNYPHSGRYVCRIDKSNQCSPTFYKQLNALRATPLKKVIVEGWFYLNGTNCVPNLVVDIRDKNEKPTEYLTQDVKSVSAAVGKWIEVSFSLDLTTKNRNLPENFIRIYAINNSPEQVLVDDLKIKFE